jgi:hypothetical protein
MSDKKPGRSGLPGILIANAVTVLIALWQQWPLALLLWPFWIQSVVIGWYSRKRILALKQFSVEGFKINGRTPEPTAATRNQTATFFVIHYGFFHFGYLMFLLAGAKAIGALDWLLIAGTGVAFWLGHKRSHALNVDADTRAKRNIGSMMFLPYARILPMHLCAGLAAVGTGDAATSALATLAFCAMKTGADVLMHVVEHRWLQKPAPEH